MTRIAVVGDRHEKFAAQDSIGPAVAHSAAVLGAMCDVEWIPTPELVDDPASRLAGADAVWCAPGSPFLSLQGALEGIRWAREGNVLGVAGAQHAEYDPNASDLFIHELLCSLVGQTMSVCLVDDFLVSLYGATEATESYYCRFGLNPIYRPALEEAGLRAAGVDAADGDVRIVRLDTHPFFVATLFVPQTSSTPDRPHPVITAFVRAAVT